LRGIFRHCGVLKSTPNSSGFARLASGAFYFAIPILTFYELIKDYPVIILKNLKDVYIFHHIAPLFNFVGKFIQQRFTAEHRLGFDLVNSLFLEADIRTVTIIHSHGKGFLFLAVRAGNRKTDLS